MTVRTNSLQRAPTRPAALNQLIVARGEPELYRTLQRRFRHYTAVTIVLDRRHGERRQAVRPVPVERRLGERRSALYRGDDLPQRKYIFARPQARCPHD